MAKSKLTPKTQKTILEAIEKGAFSVQACKAAGISESTYYSWLDQGREAEVKQEAWEGLTQAEKKAHPELKPSSQELKYLAFLESVGVSEAKAENQAVQVIVNAMPKDWRAALSYLERKHHERWGQKQTIQASVSGSMGIEQKNLEDLSDEELDEILQGADEES